MQINIVLVHILGFYMCENKYLKKLSKGNINKHIAC